MQHIIRFAICDDDISYMNSITEIIENSFNRCKKFDEQVECLLYSSSDELLKNYIKDNIDIVFMDIECGDKLGFDIAREIVKITRNAGIVYMTNYSSYITQAFVCRPLGFISKDSIINDIDYTMTNVVDYLDEIKRIIIFRDGVKKLKINANDIKSINVYNHRLYINLLDRNINIYGQLSDYEKVLLEYGFLKISRGVIVNAKYITNINGCDLYMSEEKYRISREKAKDIYTAWSLYGV